MDFAHLKRNMLCGWNTWYNNSVLTHVLLPEGIALSLGIKYFNTGKVLREALIGRFGDMDEKIYPGPRSFDGTYTELNLKCCDHEMTVQSAAFGDEQYLLVTPVKNSLKPPALFVSASILWNKSGYTQLEGGRLFATTPSREIEFFIDGKRIRQLNTGITNPYIAVELSKSVAISTDRLISARELGGVMEQQKRELWRQNAQYKDLSEAYNAMRTCLAWDTIYEPENDQICSPVSRLWNIGWGGYVLFDWDTYFSSMLAMLDNKDLAYANAIAITHEKTESGFIPNFGAADDDKSRDRSEPPVGSLAVREIFRIYREKWLVEYLFDDLLAWNRWFAENRLLPNGQLCWGSNPYTPRAGKHWETEGVNDTLGAALESGMDNSPMYDGVPFDKKNHLMQLADVGLTGLYIMDCEKLAELADITGRKEGVELRERAEKSKQGLEELWDDEFGLYLNKRTDTGTFSRSVSAANFYAFFSDKVSKEHAERMINEHFYNCNEFYGEYIIPDTGRNEPAYKDQLYWRGRIWAPSNYLAYIAMRVHELDEPCRDLAAKSRKLILKEWLEKGHVHENYNADTGEGCDSLQSDKFYHWGGLLSLIALIDAGYAAGPEKPL
ncbi:MAG: hypothetical protein LBS48_04250 [Treponema sp.]|jgi:hypothetical protein|nr:hypothetical protein [Treponema sp.]